MSSERGQHIEANCKIIWGDDDYDLEIDTDDYLNDTLLGEKRLWFEFWSTIDNDPPSSFERSCLGRAGQDAGVQGGARQTWASDVKGDLIGCV
jgi:hypothetical protein